MITANCGCVDEQQCVINFFLKPIIEVQLYFGKIKGFFFT
jgi:hypothetical protein